ncbi:MAG: trypsin-like peptidase domain-containing protein [Pseudomonadales bacterium]|nr:trypsin-like peptidase domain-containing protein [Pseudomonadales bacterium]
MPKFLRFAGWPLITGILCALLYLQLQHPSQPKLQTTGIAPQEDVIHSYADAVDKAMPSVVNIFTRSRIQRAPTIEDWFNRFYLNQKPKPQYQTSLGSGVIVDDSGFLLTNYHVIENAESILVMMNDGRETLASIVGFDKEIDLAVLKINLRNIQAIEFADINQARVGDIVLAIGNPFGVGQTVTQGIISAANRQGLGLNSNFIQTDASINQGNSGGALINSRGKLLGINTAIYNINGVFAGIGYAIPGDTALRVLNDIIETGHVVRGWLGIIASPVPPEIANKIGLPKGIGLIVSNIYKNSPAHVAGILPGDIITHVNKQPLSADQVGIDEISKTRPGEKISVVVIREGKALEIGVTPEDSPRK